MLLFFRFLYSHSIAYSSEGNMQTNLYNLRPHDISPYRTYGKSLLKDPELTSQGEDNSW